jgi:hypothetical protein
MTFKEQLQKKIERASDETMFYGGKDVFVEGANLLSDLLVDCYEALETIKETIKMVPHDSLDEKFLDIANSEIQKLEAFVKEGEK